MNKCVLTGVQREFHEMVRRFVTHGVHGSPAAMLYFDDARLPAENLIGRDGGGFRQVARTLERGRVNVAMRLDGS